MNLSEEQPVVMSSKSNDKDDKVREIIEREFKRELKTKEEEALMIEEEISKTKQVLQKLRYAIISNYYKTGSSEVQTQVQNDIQCNSLVPSGIQELDQKPIHPSLKKLIGKKPVNYHEILNSRRTMRKTREVASAGSERVVRAKPSTLTSFDSRTTSQSSSRSTVNQLTSSRGKNQIKHTLVVGNTSQYVHEPNSNITHKWMCYVKTKSSIGVERIVKKVRFLLDQSYKPNDVIEVTSSPFQLTRRGYGEFLIEVLIFFKDDLKLKPVRVFHQLVLDTKRTGHQMLGKETVSELWTRNFLTNECELENANEVENEIQCHLMDHDYYKTSDDHRPDVQAPEDRSAESVKAAPDESNKTKANRDLNPTELGRVNQWIQTNFPHFYACEESISHVNVQDNEMSSLDEPDIVELPENLEVEKSLIELTCRDIEINPSSFNQSSKLLLIKSLQLFMKQLVENSFAHSCLRDDKIVMQSDVEKALTSRPEFDFLKDLIGS